MRITAICNQKGGVGKTTLTAAIAERLAARGRRVLAIDADPQGNLTAHLGVEVGEGTLTLADALLVDVAAGKRAVDPGSLGDFIVDAGGAWTGLVDLVPADLALASREQDVMIGRELRLRRAINGGDLHTRYDHILIDCPPSLGQLTANALLASDRALCVTEARANAVEGLRQMLGTIEDVNAAGLGSVEVVGIAVNRFRPDRADPVAWLGKLEDEHRETGLLIRPEVPEREFVAKASTQEVPLALYPRVPAGALAVVIEAVDAIVDRLDAR